MVRNRLSMSGPGDGDRFFGRILASGTTGAATTTAIHSHQTNEREKTRIKSERQDNAVSRARREVRDNIWSQEEGGNYLERFAVSREALEVDSWNPLTSQIQQTKSYQETLAEVKAYKKSNEIHQSGGCGGFGQEQSSINTVSVDPNLPVSPEPSFSRSAGWGALAAISLFTIMGIISHKIRANRSSNEIAAWLYSALSPSSEKLIDFSEETGQSFEILNEKLDKASRDNTEIIRLLASIDQKLG